MNLKSWLAAKKIERKDFAKTMKTTRQMVDGWVNKDWQVMRVNGKLSLFSKRRDIPEE